MARDGIRQIGPETPATVNRKGWSRPICRRLRAGLAENVPGAHINDGPLEMIGS